MPDVGENAKAPQLAPKGALRYKCPYCGATKNRLCRDNGQACVHQERIDKYLERNNG